MGGLLSMIPTAKSDHVFSNLRIGSFSLLFEIYNMDYQMYVPLSHLDIIYAILVEFSFAYSYSLSVDSYTATVD